MLILLILIQHINAFVIPTPTPDDATAASLNKLFHDVTFELPPIENKGTFMGMSYTFSGTSIKLRQFWITHLAQYELGLELPAFFWVRINVCGSLSHKFNVNSRFR